ncbi:hypothetical protein IWW50_001349 [Coemansia erecta]|nr:hypothetical protein GGF43_001997 [Coemansia sp. RSA 2618]KAJ2828517.1 hypothetical protein IWW50_001349 [Coemansia erecta]
MHTSILLLVTAIFYLAAVLVDCTPEVSTIQGAMLAKNNVQTSCEIALIDGSSGFVAASCVVDATGAVDTSSSFAIYTDSTSGFPATTAPILSGSIHVHPQFSMSNFANNIAIVQFSLGGNPNWKMKIAVDHGTWSKSLYVRRYIMKNTDMKWGNPRTGGSALSRTECAASSGLYAANYFDFECSSDLMQAMVGSKCPVPYGSVYAAVNDQLAIGGLYSHSVIQGDMICDSSKTVNYYVLLSNYIAFAQNVLGRGVLTLSTGNFMVQTDVWYSMEPEQFGRASNEKLIAGNAFSNKDGEVMLTATETNEPTGNSNGNGNGGGSGSGSGSSNNGSSGGQATPQASNAAPASSAPNASQPTSSNQGTVVLENNTGGPNNNDAQDNNTANPTGDSTDNNDGNGSNDDSDNNDSDGSTTRKRNPEDDGNAPSISVSDGKRATNTDDDSSPSATNPANDKDASNDDSDSGNSGSTTHKSKKLKGGEIAAIVICLTIFCVLAVVGGYYGLRWYREYRVKRWTPDAVQQILESHIADSEMGNTPQPRFDLPSYGNHRGTMFVDAGPGSRE